MKYKYAIAALEGKLETWIKECENEGLNPRSFIHGDITESMEAGIRLLKEASSLQ